MQHTKHLRRAFIEHKGFLTSSKDAMENKVQEVVSEKVIDLVEEKREEIIEAVVGKIEGQKEEIERKVDQVEETVEKAADEVGKKLEEVAKPITDIIDKLDDNPQIARALDIIGDQFDGREISCSCFGWLFALRIARKTSHSSPAKLEETLQKTPTVQPSQHSKVTEVSHPTVPQ